MYSSLLTEDTYKRADAIYRSIVDEFNPHLKEFVAAGKNHDKNVLEVGKSYKACQASTVKIGIVATSSPGSKDVGKCIMDIAETMQEVNVARDVWMQKFRNDIIFPMERKSEQDGKYIVGVRKKAQEEFKAKSCETEKAMSNLQKVNKRSMSKPNSKKIEEKANKAQERLTSAKSASEMVAHEMLNRAFCEERRRYCFFVEKQCGLIQAWIDYHRTAAGILEANLESWKAVAASDNELLPGAVALIESSMPRKGNVTLDELDMNVGIGSNKLRQGAEMDSSHYATLPKKIDVNLKRSATTRITGSPKEIDTNNPYRIELTPAKSNDQPEKKSDNTDDDENDEIEPHAQLQIVDHSSPASMGRVTPTSQELKMIFRKSDGSHISESSQTSSFCPVPKEEARKSLNDSGISVEDFGNAVFEPTDGGNGDKASDEIKVEKDGQIPSTETKTTEADSKRSSTISKNSSDGLNDKVEVFYESLYDYSPELGSNKLSIRRGDKISVYNGEEKGGWMYGTNKRTYQKGWFPVNYTTQKKLEPEEITSPIIMGVNAQTTPPPSPFRFEQTQTRSRGIAVPIPTVGKKDNQPPSPPILITSFGPTSPEEDSPRDGNSAKMVAGRNVFQFAKDLGNPFEEIQLRKTTTEQLH